MAIQRFWDKYLALLRRYGIDPRAERWYVRRAELYIESVQGRRLTEHRPADVNGYLAELGRLGRLEDWRFRQVVDAIQKPGARAAGGGDPPKKLFDSHRVGLSAAGKGCGFRVSANPGARREGAEGSGGAFRVAYPGGPGSGLRSVSSDNGRK